MVIARSVGIAGRNDLTDVLVVQLLFNMNLPQFGAPVPKKLDTDGRIGSKTLKAIEAAYRASGARAARAELLNIGATHAEFRVLWYPDGKR